MVKLSWFLSQGNPCVTGIVLLLKSLLSLFHRIFRRAHFPGSLAAGYGCGTKSQQTGELNHRAAPSGNPLALLLPSASRNTKVSTLPPEYQTQYPGEGNVVVCGEQGSLKTSWARDCICPDSHRKEIYLVLNH